MPDYSAKCRACRLASALVWRIGHDRFLYELRDHRGEPYGIEAQFYQNEEFLCGPSFERRMGPTRTPREMAVAWAEQEQAIEADRR